MATKKKAPAKKAKGQAAKKAPAKSKPSSMKDAPKAMLKKVVERRAIVEKRGGDDPLADILPEPVVRKMPAALLGAINGAPAGRQRAMRRAWTRGQMYTLDSVSVETLQAIKTDAGTFVAALIFECAEQAILDKLGVQRKRRDDATRLKPATLDRIAAGIAKYSPPQGDTPAVRRQPAQPRAARVLVNDAHLVVPLHTVDVGRTVKTPDCPDEGLEGAFATIVRQGIGSTTVRLGTTRRSVKDRNGDTLAEFDAPGRAVSWAPNTMVVVVDADGYDAACDERSYGDPHVDADEVRVAVERAEQMQF